MVCSEGISGNFKLLILVTAAPFGSDLQTTMKQRCPLIWRDLQSTTKILRTPCWIILWKSLSCPKGFNVRITNENVLNPLSVRKQWSMKARADDIPSPASGSSSPVTTPNTCRQHYSWGSEFAIIHCSRFIYYLPSTLFVITSWVSFLIPPEVKSGNKMEIKTKRVKSLIEGCSW